MPLSPPGEYRKTRGIIRMDTYANIPAATDVLEGTLFFATDTYQLYRSNGTTWDFYAVFGDGGVYEPNYKNLTIGDDSSGSIHYNPNISYIQAYNNGASNADGQMQICGNTDTAPDDMGEISFGSRGVSAADRRGAVIVSKMQNTTSTLQPLGTMEFHTWDGSFIVARMKIHETGVVELLSPGHLKFPTSGAAVASSDPNTIEVYEESTWTPTDTSGAALAITVTSAKYIKLGRLVHVSFNITYPVTASGANAAIGGLPFTVDTAQDGALSVGFQNTGISLMILVFNSGTAVYPFNAITGAAITNTQLSGKNLIVAGTYLANS